MKTPTTPAESVEKKKMEEIKNWLIRLIKLEEFEIVSIVLNKIQ